MSAKTVPKQQSSTKQSNEQIIGGFNELRQEQRQVANKVAELEADLTEHKLVTEALAEVDGQRKCFRMIGGVLVERTVAEVLPSLQKNKEMISSLIETLKQQIIQKGQQITEYMDKHGIQVRSQPTAGDDNNKAGDQKAVVGGESSGVLTRQTAPPVAAMATQQTTTSCSSSSSSYSSTSISSSSAYLLVDSGAALANRKFAKDVDSVIARARDSGVQRIVVRTTNIQSTKDGLRLSRLFPETLVCAAGLSAHESRLWNRETEQQIEDVLRAEECVAIGDCGLDFSRDFSPKDTQLDVLRCLATLADRLTTEGLPRALLVRQNGAHEELVGILREFCSRIPIVVSFRGSEVEAKEYLSFGAFLSISSVKEESIQRLIQTQELPIQRILLMSDSPFQCPNLRSPRIPETARTALTGRSMSFVNRYCTFARNEPCSVSALAELVAGLSGQLAEEVALQTTFNALKVLGLSVK